MSPQNALISICNVQDDKLRYEACWSLTNIVSGTSEQTWAAVKAGATQHLVNLSVHPSLNVAEQVEFVKSGNSLKNFCNNLSSSNSKAHVVVTLW